MQGHQYRQTCEGANRLTPKTAGNLTATYNYDTINNRVGASITQNGTDVHHAVIVTKVENGEIYYAGHTNSAFDKPLSENIGDNKVLVVRIKDDAC